VERVARADHLLVQHRLPHLAQLELRPAGLHEPRLLLLAVELQAERSAGLHEEDFAAIALRERPDQLVPPRLLDLPDLEGPAIE
jgi:hypothetical protein